MHTLPKNFLLLHNENVVSKELLNLILRQVHKMKFDEALKSIDVALNIIGEKPKHASAKNLGKIWSIDALNKIKEPLNAYLDSRTTI